jgi:hypothetical protein
MWPGRVKSCACTRAAVVGAASARAVSARSCAEIPVEVPVRSIRRRSALEGWGARNERKGRTVFVVDRDGVCGAVPLLVLWDHHRDGERLEALAWQ